MPPAIPVPTQLELVDISPMLLDERKRPPLDEADWIAETKYDGYRMLAKYGDGQCELRTRNGTECSRWFPEIASSLAATSDELTVVDGEVCCLDDLGRTDFDALHDRARRRRWTEGDMPVTFCIFDLLIHDGRNIMQRPLLKRKALLQKLLDPAPEFVLFARHISADDVGNPLTWLYAHALELKLEGIVAKRADSIYQPGVRTPDWIKIKRPGATPPQRFHRGPITPE